LPGAIIAITAFSDGRFGMAIVKRTAVIAGLAALWLGLLLPAAPKANAAAYDGNWSVLIVTQSGTCDQAYRYAVQIVNGQIVYPDQTINLTGHVDGGGHVRVLVSAGGQSASGYGRLYGGGGQGRWSGKSSTSRCAGYWQAERR
jgi:hypothetical protein